MTITSNISTIHITTSEILAVPIIGYPIFLYQTEIENIKRNKPTEVSSFISNEVATAISKSLQSVTSNGDGHNFNVYDYNAIQIMSNAVRDLGLGYVFSNNVNYARKAISHIFNFCIQSETYMNPSYIGNNLDAIRLWTTVPAMIYGANLTWGYNDINYGWGKLYNNGITTKTYKNHFIDWVTKFITASKTESEYGKQNVGNWRLVAISSCAALLNDTTNLTYAFNRFKQKVGAIETDRQIGKISESCSTYGCQSPACTNADNLMKYELDRYDSSGTKGRSLSYSVYAMNAMSLTAEIARHKGTNLYAYKYNGRGLETVLDKYAPYVYTPSTWVCQQESGFKTMFKHDAGFLYELAYNFSQKTSYRNILISYGRPFTSRVLGKVTLTHGRL